MRYHNFREAVSYAIARELEEAGLYRLFAKKAKEPASQAMLNALAEQEKQHQAQLEGLKPEQMAKARVRPGGTEIVAGTNVTFTPDMSFVAVLRLAMQREEESIQLYAAMQEEAYEPELRKFFGVLVAQERAHKAKLQEEYDSIVLKDY